MRFTRGCIPRSRYKSARIVNQGMVFNRSMGGLEPRGGSANLSSLTKIEYDAESSEIQAVSSGETPVLYRYGDVRELAEPTTL